MWLFYIMLVSIITYTKTISRIWELKDFVRFRNILFQRSYTLETFELSFQPGLITIQGTYIIYVLD
jgi:hypothetical protein